MADWTPPPAMVDTFNSLNGISNAISYDDLASMRARSRGFNRTISGRVSDLVGQDLFRGGISRRYSVAGMGDGMTVFNALQGYLSEAAREQRDYEQSSAREAMAFEAQQAELNRSFQQSSAREAMAFEAEQAQLSRDWQENMSNTAYQRAVADLQAAGLNPALAYQQGGAATTSGATASGQASSGSSAAGHRATGTKAEVATEALVDIVKAYINQSSTVASSALGMFKFVL